MEIGGVKIRGQQSMVDGLKEQIANYKDKIIKLTVERSTRVKSLKKATALIAKKQEELEVAENELEDNVNKATLQREAACDLKKQLVDVDYVYIANIRCWKARKLSWLILS
jgi:hypothetical protein